MEQGFDLLTNYENRQVIINYYEEDGMIDRKGFFFDSIQIHEGEVRFIKGGQILHFLPLAKSLTKLAGFSNHYSLGEGEQRVEIYFP